MIVILGRGSRGGTGVVGLLLVVAGVVLLVSGAMLLALIALAGASIGGAVMLFRRMTGRPGLDSHRRRQSAPLEVEADYEILPPNRSRTEIEERPSRD